MKKSKHNFILFFLIISFVIIQVSFIKIMYDNSIDEIGENAINISKSVEQFIDIDEYKNIINTREKNEYFFKLQRYFSKIQKNTGAKYIYVERKLDNKVVEYVFDAEKDSFGEKDDNTTPVQYNTKNMGSFKTGEIDYEHWGKLVSGYTPIIDKNGDVIGLVGVDFAIDISLLSASRDVRSILLYSLIVIIYILSFVLVIYKKLKNDRNDILKLYDSVLKALSKTLRKKSEYTWQHSIKVAEFTEIISREAGFKGKELALIKWAALLHDIGKIGIPESILNKTTALTNAEFDLIKQHPIYSREILAELFDDNIELLGLNEFKILADIASYHHERWDGKGYPYKLSGEDIPMISRIVSICDAWEAMLAKRPYKEPMSREKAINEIKEGSGSQFDPNIVDIFLTCIDEELI
jgi:putative nucleotidyltransferase with HDIG domain